MANFEFNCPHCNQALEAPDEMLGQTIECPSCSKAINLPTPAPTSPPIPLQIETKACPFCGEEILAKAMKCKHCGEFLDETLRRQAQTEPHRSSGNPVHHVQSFVCWFTGLQQLQGFRIKTLVSDVFKRRTKEDIDAYFECGGPHATPLIANVPTEWPHPWFFWRLLFSGILVLIGFQFGLAEFDNAKLVPGLIIVGAFFVPLACGSFFFEYNVLRNISLYQTLKCIVAGGLLSLLAALLLFKISSIHESFLGSTSAGIVEETAKLFTVLFFVHGRNDTSWILNGMVVGAAVGVGFAGFETAGYIFESLIEGYSMHETLYIRAIFAPFGHVVWTASTAGALWLVKQHRPFHLGMLFDWKFLRVFLFVVLLHMFWNSGLLFEMRGRAVMYGWIISLLGSWYLALLLIQEGLTQVKTSKLLAEASSAPS